MQERLTLGRDRVARFGTWTGGPIPFGYDVDEQGVLILSARLINAGETEADVARSVFERIANGSTLVREAQRLNALNIVSPRPWAGGLVEKSAPYWTTDRPSRMLMNRIYVGVSVSKSRNKTIERPAPPLIDEAVWRRARAQVAINRAYTVREMDRIYLLRGLITCGECGSVYVGSVSGKVRNGGKAV